MLIVYEITKKKPKPKAITRIIWEETKIETNRAQRQKAGTGSGMNSAGLRHEQCRKMQISQCSIFLHFLLFFPSGI